MNAQALEQALAFAELQESAVPADFSAQVAYFGRQLGPLPKQRARTNGIILRHGYIVAEWGDTAHVDPIYSVAKSFLSTICGLAVERGLIRNVGDRVAEYVHDGGYESPHNALVTWEQHLYQTSEWEGSIWGKSHEFLGSAEFGVQARPPRPLHPPGSYWEYNDVRINRLALSLLRLWRRPLPEVLREEILDPIGASNTWRYLGYDNATVDIDGRPMVSVSGGTRWGGGVWMSTRDAARFGYLVLRKGRWGDRQLVSEQWLRAATTPSRVKPVYGYLWWLNTGKGMWRKLPTASFAAMGHGSNIIWIDPVHDLVVVWRWYRDEGEEPFLQAIVDAIER